MGSLFLPNNCKISSCFELYFIREQLLGNWPYTVFLRFTSVFSCNRSHRGRLWYFCSNTPLLAHISHNIRTFLLRQLLLRLSQRHISQLNWTKIPAFTLHFLSEHDVFQSSAPLVGEKSVFLVLYIRTLLQKGRNDRRRMSVWLYGRVNL